MGLKLLTGALRGGEAIVCDNGNAGREFAERVGELGAVVLRPRRRDEPGGGHHLAPIRWRIESVFWTFKGLLGLVRHGARTIGGLCVRVASRLLALAACIPSAAGSGARAARWSAMPPERVESTSRRRLRLKPQSGAVRRSRCSRRQMRKRTPMARAPPSPTELQRAQLEAYASPTPSFHEPCPYRELWASALTVGHGPCQGRF